MVFCVVPPGIESVTQGLKVFVKIDFHIKDKEEQGIEQRPPMMIKHVCYGCILWLLYAMTKYIVDKEISRAILWGLGRDCRCKENEAMTN